MQYDGIFIVRTFESLKLLAIADLESDRFALSFPWFEISIKCEHWNCCIGRF